MKSLIIKILLIITFHYPSLVYCQTPRTVDLRVRIIEPMKGNYVKSPQNLNIKFSMYNYGPDKITPEDTLRFFPSNNDSNFKQKIVTFNKITLPGDSDVFTISLPIDSRFDNNYYQICIGSAIAYNRSSTNSLLPEPLNTQNNNSNCITLKHRSQTSSISSNISSEFIQVNPNPAQHEIFITFPIENNDSNSLFVMYGPLGQSFILQTERENRNQIRLNTSELANGLYYLLFKYQGKYISKPILITK